LERGQPLPLLQPQMRPARHRSIPNCRSRPEPYYKAPGMLRFTPDSALTRPFARDTAWHRRMGHKLSIGLTPMQVARLEGLPAADLESLLADSDFAALAEGDRALHAMLQEEQCRILTQLARHLLMEATALGDVRVATYILLQERMGKDPARTLADGVIAAANREPRPAPLPAQRTPSAAPCPAYPSDDPDLRAMQRVEDRLCGELAHEHAAVHAAVAADEAAAEDLSAASVDACDPDLATAELPRLDQEARQEGADAEPDQAGTEGVERHRSRRSPRPHSSTLPSYEQARAIEAMRLLRSAPPDEPPTPRAGAP
jgi:hypothetical protein